jgi:hypothetical protein
MGSGIAKLTQCLGWMIREMKVYYSSKCPDQPWSTPSLYSMSAGVLSQQ